MSKPGPTARRLEDRLQMLLDSATVFEGGCMEVDCAHDSGGYPRMSIDGRNCKVSRLLMPFLMADPVDITGLEVMHTCHNPGCINPEHLRLGTHADNMQDMVDAGRARGGIERGGISHQSGERHGNARITWNEVHEIRRLYATGQYSQRELAGMFGVPHQHIGCIVRNERWKE